MINVEPLLSKQNAPLDKLSLYRIQLDRTMPRVTFHLDGEEGLLYPLVGTVHVIIEGMKPYGVPLGRRRSVFHRQSAACRFHGGVPWEISMQVQGNAADCLLVTCRVDAIHEANAQQQVAAIHGTGDERDVECHRVGHGAHRREVRVYPTPPDYLIHCGETVNPPGKWSSWPSHFREEEQARYAEWEECFFVVTSGSGLIHEVGTYCTGERVNGWRPLSNGMALVTPLGSHPVVASPEAPLFYAWFYRGRVVRKAYPHWATDVAAYSDVHG